MKKKNRRSHIDEFLWHVKGEGKHINVSLNRYPNEAGTAVSLWRILTEDFIREVKPGVILFMNFKSQVDKAVFLAILSTMRLHSIQTFSMFRYAVDSMSISLYVLFYPKESLAILSKRDVTGRHRKDNTIKLAKKAYKWLRKFDSKLNARFIEVKKVVANPLGAHVDFSSTAYNMDVRKKVWLNIFDKPRDKMQKFRFWIVADTLCYYIDFLRRHASKKGILLNSDVLEEIDGLFSRVAAIKGELQQVWKQEGIL